VVSEIDWSVGEILSTLKRTGLDRDTLVMFSSDNGPWHQGSPGRLRGRKGWTFEGGVREPFIARMPGRIPVGRVTDAVGSTLDILPTVAKLCGAPLPSKPLDGVDLWPVLSGRAPAVERDVLLYFDNWHVQCARWKNWKLHVARYNNMAYNPAPPGGRMNLPLDKPELYDLDTSPDESYDTAADHPDVVTEILRRIDVMLPSFPEPVRQDWIETRARNAGAYSAGALPGLKK
jgi:arylsulfatase